MNVRCEEIKMQCTVTFRPKWRLKNNYGIMFSGETAIWIPACSYRNISTSSCTSSTSNMCCSSSVYLEILIIAETVLSSTFDVLDKKIIWERVSVVFASAAFCSSNNNSYWSSSICSGDGNGSIIWTSCTFNHTLLSSFCLSLVEFSCITLSLSGSSCGIT